MKLTNKQLTELNKAKSMIKKAFLLINKIEQESDLKYSMNDTLASKAKDLVNSFDDEILMIN